MNFNFWFKIVKLKVRIIQFISMDVKTDPQSGEASSILFRKALSGGAITGALGVLLNNLYGWLYMLGTGMVRPDFFSFTAVTLGSFFAGIVASVVYFALVKHTKYYRVVFTVGVLVFGLLSLVGPLSSNFPDGTPVPDGFAALTLPMHLISTVLIAVGIPKFCK